MTPYESAKAAMSLLGDVTERSYASRVFRGMVTPGFLAARLALEVPPELLPVTTLGVLHLVLEHDANLDISRLGGKVRLLVTVNGPYLEDEQPQPLAPVF